MSLKAKLEAVIYAAEEPVTLAQLAALFADDALALKSERAASSVSGEPESRLGESLPLLDEGFAQHGPDQTSPLSATERAVAANTSNAAFVGATPSESETTPGADAENQPASALPDDAGAVDPTSDLKREARMQDREVRGVLKGLIDELIVSCASDERGVEIREIAGGYRMATKAEYHDAVRGFVRALKPPLKLSLQALETLAVVAYKQPVTAPEVSEIRGVESAATLGSLLSRKLISTAGRKQVIGRPILYKTTREFLLRFGLKDVSELPSMDEFQQLAEIELDVEAPAGGSGAQEESAEELDLESELDETAEAKAGDESDAAAEGSSRLGTTKAIHHE